MPTKKVNLNLEEISPALSFTEDKAYVTAPFAEITDKGYAIVNYLVTSEKEKYQLTCANLLKHKLYSMREPNPVERWSRESIDLFLKGKVKGSISEVYEEINTMFGEYVDLGRQEWTSFLSCWTIGTYFHRLFESYPYLHLNGNMNSGKTKTLTLISILAFNGELTFNSTPAYITRVIHNNHASCCIDEAERLSGTGTQDYQLTIGMYNSGYKKGAYCGKSEQVGNTQKWVPRRFEAYSPKVFAGIEGLAPTLASRCIPITMIKTDNTKIQNKEVNINDKRFQAVRDRLYLVLMEHFKSISMNYQQINDLEIVGREMEIWKAILAVAKTISPELYDQMRSMALDIQAGRREANSDENLGIKLVRATEILLEQVIVEGNFYPVHVMVEHMEKMGDEVSYWLRSQPIHMKARMLSTELRKAGLIEGRAIQKRVNGKNTKGFVIDPGMVDRRLKSHGVDTITELLGYSDTSEQEPVTRNQVTHA